MKKNDLFTENLMRFSRFWPKAALALETLPCPSIEFCRTEQGELNLKKKFGKADLYYHSNAGAMDEAREWFEETAPLGTKVLFIYGVGLGYYFDVLENWLKEDPGRYLIFMEDDLCVLRKLLETEQGAKILQNTQTILHHFQTPGEKGWGKFRSSFQVYISAFSRLIYQFSSLKMYDQERSIIKDLIFNQIKVNMVDQSYVYADLIDHAEQVCENFYLNTTRIFETYKGENFFGEFNKIPCIICGAGPSISPQLPDLKSVTDRALIFASGTAVNVLNKKGIMPHFGACLDFDPTQESRFLTNFAYEVPFFYHNRFYAKASTKIHGPRLFIADIRGIPEAEWFYQELGLTPLTGVTCGVSTSNFCNELAGRLSCDPIIFAGMDLAYTDSKRYAEGVAAHPTDDRIHHQNIDYKSPQTISTPTPGIRTRWDWLVEASAITEFKHTHPDVCVINVTEGGMKIIDIPSLKLKDVIDKYLTRTYDLQGWIHAVIQQSPQEVAPDKLFRALETWGESLKRCKEYVSAIKEILIPIRNSHLTQNTPLPQTLPGKVPLLQTNLEEEIAYKHLFHLYDDTFNCLAQPELNKLTFYPEQFDAEKRQLWLFHKEIGRVEFLYSFIEMHNTVFAKVFQEYKEQQQQGQLRIPAKNLPSPAESPEDIYLFENGAYVIYDHELGIEFRDERPAQEIQPEKLLYPDGSLKGEMYYAEGHLHGPASFYHKDGTLLARSWFVKDMRVGKCWLYYPSGRLFCLQKYIDGKLHGPQTYYYLSGAIKSILNYVEGELHGEVSLFYSNTSPKRVLNFSQGKLHGIERMWNDKGVQVLEAEYYENKPTGNSKTWYDTGQLAKQIDFHADPADYDITLWNAEGTLIGKQSSLSRNPLDDVIKKSHELKQMLEDAAEKIKALQNRKQDF